MHSTSMEGGPSRPQTRTAEAHDDVPRCRCGYDRHHYMVSASPSHGVGGWLRLFVGISTRPHKITYRCRRCDDVIEESTEPEALDAFY